MLVGDVDYQVPSMNGRLFLQSIAKKKHCRMLGRKMTGVKEPQARILRPAGDGVLDLGGHKDIRPLVQGGFGKIGTGAAADSDGRHLLGSRAGFQDPWRVAGLPDSGKKSSRVNRCGIGAEAAESAPGRAVVAGRHQWFDID